MSQLYFPSLAPDQQAGNVPASLAELQGALCGLLCMDEHASRTGWHSRLFDDFSPGDEEQQALTALFDETIQGLNSPQLAFQLALPGDDAPLSSRLSAMADWCQGLVYGLGTSGMRDDTDLSEDSREYVTDVIKISQVRFDDLEDSEREENDFEELVEYLRMGLLLLYGELQSDPATDKTTEH